MGLKEMFVLWASLTGLWLAIDIAFSIRIRQLRRQMRRGR